MKRTISIAAIMAAAITALVMTVSYAWGMECPTDLIDEFSLRIESVTVDGVPREDLSGYYDQNVVNTTLLADRDRSQPRDNGKIISNRVTIRFQARGGSYGSYDQIFRVVSGSR